MESSRIELREVETADAWERALAAASWCVWQQSWAYGAAAARSGHRVVRFQMMGASEALGVVQLVGRTAIGGCIGLWHALGGPVWRQSLEPTLQAAALKQLGRRLGGPARLLVVTPAATLSATRPALQAAGLRRVMTGYTTALLPIEASPDVQLRGFNHGWRSPLRRPARGLAINTIVPGADPLALSEALALHEASRRLRGYATVATPIVAHAARFGRALMVRAHHEGELAAFMLFMLHGTTATYQIGWAGDEGRRRDAHRHLLWHALPRLREAGCRTLDLGGLNVPAGIVAFKLGTGAVPTTLAGSYV